jgi:hypothetical protein
MCLKIAGALPDPAAARNAKNLTSRVRDSAFLKLGTGPRKGSGVQGLVKFVLLVSLVELVGLNRTN